MCPVSSEDIVKAIQENNVSIIQVLLMLFFLLVTFFLFFFSHFCSVKVRHLWGSNGFIFCSNLSTELLQGTANSHTESGMFRSSHANSFRSREIPHFKLVYRNGSECCLGEAGECCYDENKKGRLKELKMTHGAYVKRENAVMIRDVYNNGNVYLMTCLKYKGNRTYYCK